MADRATDPYLNRPIPPASPEAQEVIRNIRKEYETRIYGAPSPAPAPAQAAPQPVDVAPVATPAAPPAPATTPDHGKIKRNIKRMMEQNAPVEDIDGYIASEGVTIDELKAQKAQPEPKDLSWSDVPMEALRNIPQSAARTANAIVHPFMHPVDTAKAIGNMGYGAASKIAGAVGVQQDPQQKAEDEAQIDAVGKFFSDRYGSLDAVKQTLAKDPVGAALDAATVLTGGGGAVARAPGIVGKVGEAVAKVGSVVDPIKNAGRLATGTGKAAAAILGTTSGVGSKPVEVAFQAGRQGNKAFTENMRGQAPITDTLDMARSAMADVRSDRSKAYEAGMQSIKADQSYIDLKPIQDALLDARGMVYFEGVAKSHEAAQTLLALENKLKQWRGIQSPNANKAAGLDALKQAIGEIRQGTKPGTTSRSVADKVYNTAKSEIVNQVPDYANTMRGYSQASDTLDDLTKTFSLGETAAKDTSIRKLTSVMRNNVNTNYGRREQLMEVLAKKQPDLPYAVAGQSLNSLTPRGGFSQLSALGGLAAGYFTVNPATAGYLAASSPRVVGEAAHAAGKIAGAADAIAIALKIDPRVFSRTAKVGYATKQLTQPTPLTGEQDVGPATPPHLRDKRIPPPI